MKFARDIIALIAVSLFALGCSSHIKSEPEQSATEYLEKNYIFDVKNFTTTTEQDQSYYYVVFCLKEKDDLPNRPSAERSVDSCYGGNVVVIVEKPGKRVIGATLRDIALKRRELPQI
ncbi:hypothetical protein FFK22_039845 [Mycobacterium sp. KBS0706]|uniref:hypothetical protein n=1 Tax=Mycobacterium sp. KBS0706 TaxID=2578109 RepID=UPI00110FC132|nr:hypothetical protein [Mycobacterium sp. KBS0706]TSD83034.1 hypothetical protein FFK22_039845 [Mycobacterium sp. KBS0706]